MKIHNQKIRWSYNKNEKTQHFFWFSYRFNKMFFYSWKWIFFYIAFSKIEKS